MSTILAWLSRALPFLPAVLVVVLALAAVKLARRLTAARAGAADHGDFRLQFIQLLVILVANIALLMVLPISEDMRGQLFGLFGIMLSAAIAFSSTTFVGNVMAGLMLKAVRNFRTGDFLRVQDQFGRVSRRGLLSTEIQTEDRDLVTLPNLLLVTNPVKVVRASGTIVTAEVSLGYDVAHDRVEALLRDAAADAGLADPFVLVMELGDFSVVYRVAGLLQEVKQLLTVRSRLRCAMLDRLHGDGVEIVSPNFMNQRVLQPDAPVIARPAAATTVVTDGTVEDLAFDKAEEAESLEQLQAIHARTREAIAELADPPADADKDALARRQEILTRRLARVESAIAARKESAGDKDGD